MANGSAVVVMADAPLGNQLQPASSRFIFKMSM